VCGWEYIRVGIIGKGLGSDWKRRGSEAAAGEKGRKLVLAYSNRVMDGGSRKTHGEQYIGTLRED
jgi:hypothetical protein